VTNALGGRSEFPEVLRCVRGDGVTVAYLWPSLADVMDRGVPAVDAGFRQLIEIHGWRQVADGWQCGRHAPESGEVMDHHAVIRDGSNWLCRHCGRTWPFPSPLPDSPGKCVQRAWRVEA